MGSRRWRRVVALGVLLGAGCSSRSDEPSGVCHTDSDCADAERCSFSDSNRTRISITPCPFTRCTTSDMCEAGDVCGPLDNLPFSCGATVCQPSCETAGCQQGDACGADGLCTLVPCDEENGLTCPTHWQCAPDSGPVGTFGPGSDLPSQPQTSDRALRAGCVPLRCDETDGVSCHDLYACDPESSEDASGCAAVACADSGRCSDDVGRICAAEIADLGLRVPDAHGCVARTCLEGYECPEGFGCDTSSLDSTINGCVPVPPGSGVCVARN